MTLRHKPYFDSSRISDPLETWVCDRCGRQSFDDVHLPRPLTTKIVLFILICIVIAIPAGYLLTSL